MANPAKSAKRYRRRAATFKRNLHNHLNKQRRRKIRSMRKKIW